MKFELRKTYGNNHKLKIKSNPSMSINFNKIEIRYIDEYPTKKSYRNSKSLIIILIYSLPTHLMG